MDWWKVKLPEEYLREHGTNMMVKELCERFNVSDTIVRRKLKKLGIVPKSGRGTPHSDAVNRYVDETTGYIMVAVEKKKGRTVYRREHVVVMECIIGRRLCVDEVVHHLNWNKHDNRPENLLLLKKGEHHAYHNLAMARYTPEQLRLHTKEDVYRVLSHYGEYAF